MALADDLRAAKVLIDTPDKYVEHGGFYTAVRKLFRHDKGRLQPVEDAFAWEMSESLFPSHDNLVNALDRAIAKAEADQ